MVVRMGWKLLFWPVAKIIKRVIRKPALKQYVVDRVNEFVDIPKLDEKQEEDLLKAVVQGMIDFLEAIL